MSKRGISTRRNVFAPRRGAAIVALTFLFTLATLGAVGMFAPYAACATTLQRMNVTTISQRAAKAVIGTVISVSAEMHDGQVRTAVQVRVTEPLKGASAGLITVYVPGGSLPGGVTEAVDGAPSFAVGESACIFVDSRGWVMAGFQGKVAVRDGLVSMTGQPVSKLAAAVRAAAGVGRSSSLPQGFVDPIGAAQASPEAAAGGPVISSISPGNVAAGIGSHITITGSGFGSARGGVSFFYQSGQPRISATVFDSWTDSQIVCEVPVATVNGYSASAGSGPVVVTTAAGVASPGYNLTILYGYGLRRWAAAFASYPTTRVGYRVHPGGVARAEQLVDAGTAVWNAAGADFRFVDGGVTNAKAKSGYDGYNDLSWTSDLPDGVIAQASSWTSGGNVVECNVEFNTLYAWGDGSNYTMDVESIAMHETGHWLVLRDLYGSGDSGNVMYGFSCEGDVQHTLSAGDLAGILHIYGAAPGQAVEDTTAPTTVADVQADYLGTATIRLTATDPESGVAATYHSIDGGPTMTGASVTVSTAGTHTIDYWSSDKAGNTEAAKSAEFVVVAAPAAHLTTPRAPSAARRSRRFTVTGALDAGDTTGAVVKLSFYRLERGHWRLRKSVYVKVSDSSRYSARVALTLKGTWRVRAYHADPAHTAAYSSYRRFRVK